MLQCAAAIAGLLVAARRMRRHLAPARRALYALAVWTMALAGGLTAARLLPNASDVAFDAGLCLLLLMLATEAGSRATRHRVAHSGA